MSATNFAHPKRFGEHIQRHKGEWPPGADLYEPPEMVGGTCFVNKLAVALLRPTVGRELYWYTARESITINMHGPRLSGDAKGHAVRGNNR